MADALHNILNIVGLSFSLYAIVMSKAKATQRYTFGFSRLEVIAGFTNCCFLIFVAIFLFFRSIHTGLEHSDDDPKHSHTDNDSFLYKITTF